MAKSYLPVGIIVIVVIISFVLGIAIGFSVNLGSSLLAHPDRYKLIIRDDNSMMKFDSSSGKLWIYDPARKGPQESPWILIDGD